MPSGRPTGNHWGPAISVFETTSQTAYYYNHHVRDIGNFTVVGPTGSGKTVFLSFIAAQTQRIQPRPKLLFVDKDRGAEIFIRALGGQYETLVPGEPTGFNPLSLPDTAPNREFLYQLFAFMLRPANGADLTASEEQVIRNAIAAALTGGPAGRTLKAFSTLLRGRIRAGEGDLLARLESWMRPDQRGWLFNNDEDQFSLSSVFGFDMTRVLDDPVIRQQLAQTIAWRVLNRLNTQRAKAELQQGTSSSIMSLGKLAMSRILHEEARVRTLLLGAESLLEGAEHPRAEDANFLTLNAYFTSIGGGTDQIQRNIIGERVLGLPKEPEVDRTIPFREVQAG